MFGFNKRSEEPENLYEEPPVPEIKPCPICGKTPSVYCAGCSMLGSGASTRFWNCWCIDCDYPKRPSGLSVNYCNKADVADHWNELVDRSEKTLDAPLPECPICNKRPTLVEIVGKGMVYDCGCDCVSISSPSLNPIEVKKDWLREAARRADYLRRLRSCTDVLSRN